MGNITKFSIKRPLALLMAVLATVIFGVRAYKSLNTSLIPEVNIPYVIVQTIYPGASAEVVENQITIPLENDLYSIRGLDRIQSYSMDNVSVLALEFNLETDPDQAVIDVNKTINQMKGDLPEDASDSTVEKIDNNAMPVIEYAMYSNDLEKLSSYVTETIKPQLERIDGVGRVDIYGLNEKQVEVTLKPDAMMKGVTVSMVSDALANKVYGVSLPSQIPLGSIQNGGTEESVSINSELTSLDEIKNLYIDVSNSPLADSIPNLQPVQVKDVATVKISDKESASFYRANGKAAVGISIIKQSDASEIEVAEKVKEQLGGDKPLPLTKMLLEVIGIQSDKESYDPEIKYSNEGIEAKVTMDNSIYVKESVDGVLESVTEGILLTGLLLLLFLKNIRSTFIVLLAIPTSIVVTFIGMQVFGFTLNILSLLGIALSIGILVDDSIVVIENIFAKLREEKDPKKAAIRGRAEIASAAVAITLVDVVVYVPLAMLSGIVGQFFKEFAVTVVIATLSSLVVAFTLTPMLSSRLLNEKVEKGYGWLRWFSNFIEFLKDKYEKLLRILTARWWTVSLTILVVFAVLLSSVAIFAPNLKQEFLVMGDDETGVLQVQLPEGTSVEVTDRELKKVEEMLAKRDDVMDYYVYVGGLGSSNGATINLDYGPKEERDSSSKDITAAIQKSVDEVLPEKAVVNVNVQTQGGGTTDVQYVLTGPDFKKLIELSEEFEAKVREKDSLKDLQFSLEEKVDSLVVRAGEKSSQMGVNSLMIISALEGKLRASESGKMIQNGKEYDILVYDSNKIEKEDQLAALPLGYMVTVGSVTDFEKVSTYKSIERNNKQRSITFGANTKSGVSSGEAMNEIESIIEELDLAEDYEITPDSTSSIMEEGFADLYSALGLSIALMFMVMVALYESLVTPFVVLFTVPTAVAGSFSLLFFFDAPMDFTAMVGFIALMGLVAKNGILLVDFIEKARKEGMDVKEAVIKSGKRRLRPILMTTLAIIMASIPLVLGNVPGSEYRRGMAIVFIGGLTSSLVLTLILIPNVYLAVNAFVGIFRKKQKAESGKRIADGK
ncbi:MAG: efflux RND transporter permease subunit [Candidatus Dojkabacteria bacterium]|nr:efflux RND transporter permease subunit [Candidatus Dojkabacteria bacterium]